MTVGLDALDGSAADDLVLFDLIQYSFMLRLKQAGDCARAHLFAGLRASGLLRAGQSLANPLRLRIEVPTRDGDRAIAKAVLHLCELNGGLVITSASSITLNLQQVLRKRHRIPDSLLGLDGRRNFTKPTVECDESDLDVQLETIERCVDKLRRAILDSLPGSEVAEEKLLLRKAEVCHDLAHPEAEDIARATCRVPVTGSRFASHTDYPFTVEVGRSPTWHFSTRQRGPVRKGYAKLANLLRTELSCLHRDAVNLCMGRRHAPFTGSGAYGLAMAFYEAGGDLCCEALDHVRKVAIGGGTMHQLLVAFDGLQGIAERRRVGDGYRPSEEAAAQAKRVLNALLSDGIFHSTGMRLGTKVRDELQRLVAPGGPLVRGASPGVYCLAPKYGLALPGGTGRLRTE